MKIALLILCLALAASPAAATMEVAIDPVTGGVSLHTDAATSIEAYEITAPQPGVWNTTDARWTSLVDQALVSGWVELSGGDLLSEALFFGSPLDLAADQTLTLGTPYIGAPSVSAGDFIFRYKPLGQSLILGAVFIVPEPLSGLMLIALAPCCLRRRTRRSA